MAETKIGETQTRLEKEQIEKQKLLNDPNETVRNAAQELYDRYLHASETVRVATNIERKIKRKKERRGKRVRPML